VHDLWRSWPLDGVLLNDDSKNTELQDESIVQSRMRDAS
jgi:hypothetical protein